MCPSCREETVRKQESIDILGNNLATWNDEEVENRKDGHSQNSHTGPAGKFKTF
jgi:hypothetical protein